MPVGTIKVLISDDTLGKSYKFTGQVEGQFSYRYTKVWRHTYQLGSVEKLLLSFVFNVYDAYSSGAFQKQGELEGGRCQGVS